MCRKCEYIKDEIQRLRDHLKLNGCSRQEYWRKYHLKNRKKRNAQAFERYAEKQYAQTLGVE